MVTDAVKGWIAIINTWVRVLTAMVIVVYLWSIVGASWVVFFSAWGICLFSRLVDAVVCYYPSTTKERAD